VSSYGVYIKGSQRRIACTPKDRVNLEADGWRLDPNVAQPPPPSAEGEAPVDSPPPPPPPAVPGSDIPPEVVTPLAKRASRRKSE